MRTGILGGTFDPIHNAHLMVARKAMEAAALDRVVLIPAGVPPNKAGLRLTPPEHRLAMTRLAAEGVRGFEVSDFEIASPGVDYTVNTLRAMTNLYPDSKLFFIVGGDSLMYFDQWKDPGAILSLASIAAVYRPGFDFAELERKRAEILTVYQGEIQLVACDGMDMSGLVPAKVEEYIRSHGLYTNIV
jgi:nicotinate-nucleotide adenylyltransferase